MDGFISLYCAVEEAGRPAFLIQRISAESGNAIVDDFSICGQAMVIDME